MSVLCFYLSATKLWEKESERKKKEKKKKEDDFGRSSSSKRVIAWSVNGKSIERERRTEEKLIFLGIREMGSLLFFLLFFFLIFNFSFSWCSVFLCGGLNNYKGYHIMLLHVKKADCKVKKERHARLTLHNSNFSFSFFCFSISFYFIWLQTVFFFFFYILFFKFCCHNFFTLAQFLVLWGHIRYLGKIFLLGKQTYSALWAQFFGMLAWWGPV